MSTVAKVNMQHSSTAAYGLLRGHVGLMFQVMYVLACAGAGRCSLSVYSEQVDRSSGMCAWAALIMPVGLGMLSTAFV